MKLSRRSALFGMGTALALPNLLFGERNAWGQADASKKKVFALCVGVDNVNPSFYPNSSLPQLNGAVADARTYLQLIRTKHENNEAVELRTKRLFDGEATLLNLYRYIAWAAKSLQSGDMFVFAYAGHGTNIEDINGDEPEDEAICLFDGPFVDDEFHGLWSHFVPGVKIVMFSDSCRSGSISRAIETRRRLFEQIVKNDSLRGALNLDKPTAEGELEKLRGDAGESRGASRGPSQGASRGPSRGLRSPGEIHVGAAGSRSVAQQFVPELSRMSLPNINARLRLAGISRGDKNRLGEVPDDIDARVIQFGAASDHTDAQEVNGAGVFTTAVKMELEKELAKNPDLQKLTYLQLFDKVSNLEQLPQFVTFGRTQFQNDDDEAVFAVI